MLRLVRQNYRQNQKIFTKTKRILGKKLEKFSVDIEHIGSSALPQMTIGKNVIDILIGFEKADDHEQIVDILCKNSYYLSKDNNTPEYTFLSSREKDSQSGDIHIHLTPKESQRYKDFLLVKKFFLDNPEKISEYAKVKEDIYNKYGENRKAYRLHKSIFMEKILNKIHQNIKYNKI